MPDSFDAIVGQDAVVERLRTALARGRLPHGMVFAGPVGVGKFKTAKALASAFLQGERVAERVENNTHPDFHVVTRQLVRFHDKTGKSKAINLSIDVVREEIVKPAAHHAVEGGGKVFVVEEAETMTAAAQNGLLKTLEEPAGRAVIMLITDQPESLLPTIRSRCQTLRFAALSPRDAERVVAAHGVSAKDARRAIAVAEGSPGLAMQFLADGVVERAEALFARLDGGGGEPLGAWMKYAAEAYAAAQLERDPLGSKDAFTRQGYGLYLTLAADHLRRKLPDEAAPDRLEELCERIDAVARAEKYLSANVNVALTMQQLELSLGA